MAIEVFGRMKWVVGLRDVGSQVGSGQSHLVPIVVTKRRGQLLAVNADLPGENSGALQLRLGKFRDGDFVVTRQRIERELSIPVEIEKLISPFGQWIFLQPIQRLRNVAAQPIAIGLEKSAHLRWKRFNSLLGDQAFRVCAPGACRRGEDETGNCRGRRAGGYPSRNATSVIAHQRSAIPDCSRNVLRSRLEIK